MTKKNKGNAPVSSDWPVPWRGNPRARPSTGHGLTENYQEGIGWDSDVPREFLLGVRQGEGDPDIGNSQASDHIRSDSPARPNQNVNVFTKSRAETMRERAHVGSASWVEAPWQLGAFAQGAGDAEARGGEYAHEQRDGSHYSRPSHARIED